MERLTPFAISVGSLVGREHVRLHRNNQDAAAVCERGQVIAAVVADGCGEGARSEVGATLGAEFLARWLAENAEDALDEESRAGGENACLLNRPETAQDFADEACAALVAYLSPLMRSPLPSGEGQGEGAIRATREKTSADAPLLASAPLTVSPDDDRAQFIHRHLLFTILCAVVTLSRTVIFGVGDGAYSVNGDSRVLSSGPDNAPEYLGYRLVSPSALQVAPSPSPLGRGDPVVHHDGPTSSIRSLLIATDGFPIDAQLDRDPSFSKNPTLLQRRLVVLGERERRMFDDATAVLLQRVEA